MLLPREYCQRMASIGVFQTMLRVQKLQCLFPMLNETTCPIVQFPKNKREEHEKEAENGHPFLKSTIFQKNCEAAKDRG
jgi:hypothetical protein